MAFAYFDSGTVLHVVEDEATAKEYAHGEYVETDIAHEGGYPVVDGEVVIFENGAAYIHGNIRNGTSIAIPEAIQEIADKLK